MKDLSKNGVRRAGTWTAATYGGGTLLTHLVCSSLHGGESLIGLLLFFPWTAAFFPLFLCYKLFGLDWRVGDYGSITLGMLWIAILINCVLGALLGAVLWKAWQLMRKLLKRNNHS